MAAGLGARLSPAQLTPRRAMYGIAPLVLAILLVIGGNALHRGKIYPGVQALGVSLAGLDEAGAQAKLSANAAQFGQSQAAFGANGQTVQASLADLGVSYDAGATVNDGMAVGRGFLGIGGALRAYHLSSGAVQLPVNVSIDKAKFESKLTSMLAAAGIAPQNAEISINGTSVAVAPERSGVLPDFAAVEKQLVNELKKHQPLAMNLELHAVEPSLRAPALTAAAAAAQQFLQAPLTFSYGSRSWTVAAATAGQSVVVNPVSGADPAPTLSNDFIASLTSQFASAINAAPVDASTGTGGEFGRLIDASPGRTVDASALATLLQGAIHNGVHDFTIPVNETQPGKTSDAYLSSLGITTLLSSGTSDFSGSAPGRRQNVTTAANLINGLLIPPRKIWSYNKGIGEINANKNFVAAGATENGILGTAVGGGVCQVSTTVFRAALFAGMPIQEWWPHAFREIYYEQGGWSPGYDASIQQPDENWLGGSDFKFVNATDSWMLIRSTISSSSVLTVSLYGASTGLTVKFDAPVVSGETPVTDPPTDEMDPSLPARTVETLQPDRSGMTVHITRHVYDSTGKEILTFPMDSVYQPQAAIFRVSPDMAGSTATNSSGG